MKKKNLNCKLFQIIWLLSRVSSAVSLDQSMNRMTDWYWCQRYVLYSPKRVIKVLGNLCRIFSPVQSDLKDQIIKTLSYKPCRDIIHE